MLPIRNALDSIQLLPLKDFIESFLPFSTHHNIATIKAVLWFHSGVGAAGNGKDTSINFLRQFG